MKNLFNRLFDKKVRGRTISFAIVIAAYIILEVLMAAGVGTGRIPAWDPTCENIRIHWSGEMPWTI